MRRTWLGKTLTITEHLATIAVIFGIMWLSLAPIVELMKWLLG